MVEDYRIRRATADDAAIIARHRGLMFFDMKYVVEVEQRTIETNSIPHLIQMISHEEYFGWIAEIDGEIAASSGIMIRRLLPRPDGLRGGEEAYILNVYTEQHYRRRGLARKLLEATLDWCCERGVARVTLHPSEAGESLYFNLGFERTKEMIWKKPRYPD